MGSATELMDAKYNVSEFEKIPDKNKKFALAVFAITNKTPCMLLMELLSLQGNNANTPQPPIKTKQASSASKSSYISDDDEEDTSFSLSESDEISSTQPESQEKKLRQGVVSTAVICFLNHT